MARWRPAQTCSTSRSTSPTATSSSSGSASSSSSRAASGSWPAVTASPPGRPDAGVAPAELQQLLPDLQGDLVRVVGTGDVDVHRADRHGPTAGPATRTAVAAEGHDRLRTSLPQRILLPRAHP